MGSNEYITEDRKIAIRNALETFKNNEQRELEFPSSFFSAERKFVHNCCVKMGLKSKSRGKGNNRYVTAIKKDAHSARLGSGGQNWARRVSLQPASARTLMGFLQSFPVTPRERQELQPGTSRDRVYGHSGNSDFPKSPGRLNSGLALVPPVVQERNVDREILQIRSQLPVHRCRTEILDVIARNQVVLITGETGSGKTTQVPQYILEASAAANVKCRMLCAQPRRIAALSVAERVSMERGEEIGQTVGYHIRLESKVSPHTLLTYCTNGVLLRTLVSNETQLDKVTHVIVDEIHERDRYSDFLMIAMRDLLPLRPELRLILMSANLDVNLFRCYFKQAVLVNIYSKCYDVQELYLEDVLQLTDYCKPLLEAQKSMKSSSAYNSDWPETGTFDLSELEGNLPSSKTTTAAGGSGVASADLPQIFPEMDTILSKAWKRGDSMLFQKLIILIGNGTYDANYKHSKTGATALMIAAGHGDLETIETLLEMGAEPRLRAGNGWNALDWARNYGDSPAVVECLESMIGRDSWDDFSESTKEQATIGRSPSEQQLVPTEAKDLLEAYQASFNDEGVDLKLALCLLKRIMDAPLEGAVLIFLPGYDEIVNLRDMIMSDDTLKKESSRFSIYCLHSSMQSADQKRVFRPVARGIRKIILSTNIAEASVTIEDVVFVIDSGKMKERTFDAYNNTSALECIWVSKANAQQRRGRAGRCAPGICYRLYSRLRYRHMPENQIPEILRLPILDLCLHAKLLAPKCTSVADFLSKAPEPPSIMVLRNAIDLLKSIDAMDQFENLTELGQHLSDLPLDPQLGKMVLYAVVLKCLDPVLTIACCLSYREPFVLPRHPSEKAAAAQAKRKFGSGCWSDHLVLLRAFQAWQKARVDGWERQFASKHYLSTSSMEMIVGIRTQLLGQLRASGFVRARGGGDIRDLNANSENWAVVKAALVAGSYPNLAWVDKDMEKLVTRKEKNVDLHQSSVLADRNREDMAMFTRAEKRSQTFREFPADWMLYHEMTRIGRRVLLRCSSVVSPLTVGIFAGPSKLPVTPEANAAEDPIKILNGCVSIGTWSDTDSDDEEESPGRMLRLDEWLMLNLDLQVANSVIELRQKWHSLFLRRMRAPGKQWSQGDEAVLQTLVILLSNEEAAFGLEQPAGIGQRPKHMSKPSSYGSAYAIDNNSFGPSCFGNDRLPGHPPYLSFDGGDRRFSKSGYNSGPGDGYGSFYGYAGAKSWGPSDEGGNWDSNVPTYGKPPSLNQGGRISNSHSHHSNNKHNSNYTAKSSGNNYYNNGYQRQVDSGKHKQKDDCSFAIQNNDASSASDSCDTTNSDGGSVQPKSRNFLVNKIKNQERGNFPRYRGGSAARNLSQWEPKFSNTDPQNHHQYQGHSSSNGFKRGGQGAVGGSHSQPFFSSGEPTGRFQPPLSSFPGNNGHFGAVKFSLSNDEPQWNGSRDKMSWRSKAKRGGGGWRS